MELHLEVDENLSLREAHRQATELEEGIRKLRSEKIDVNIHIEPLGRHIATPETRAGEMRQLEMAVESFPQRAAVGIRRTDQLPQREGAAGGAAHPGFLPLRDEKRLPITRIHDVTAALEDRVKERFPQVSRRHDPSGAA